MLGTLGADRHHDPARGLRWTLVRINDGGGEPLLAVAGATDAWLPAPGIGLYHTTNGTTWRKIR